MGYSLSQVAGSYIKFQNRQSDWQSDTSVWSREISKNDTKITKEWKQEEIQGVPEYYYISAT
jgi:hypothetical protein